MTEKRYKGTSLDTRRGKWKAQARRDGRNVHLGYFDTQQEAYDAVTKETTANDTAQLAIKDTSLTSYRTPYKKDHKAGTVAQSNVLIERPWSMTILEARIFILLLRGLQTSALDRELITVPVSDLIGSGHLGGRAYELLYTALETLSSLRIDLPKSNKKRDFHKAPLMGVLHMDTGQGTISGYFSPEVMPYITNLLDSFTIGQVADLLSIKNPNAYKFYWIMQMWKFRSPHTVSVQELRELTTGGTSYLQFSDYRNRVLKPSIQALHKLNFDITFKEIRAGRNVEAVEFNIRYTEQKKQLQPTTPKQLAEATTKSTTTPSQTPLQEKVVNRLRKLQLTEAQIQKVLQVLADEKDQQKLLKVTHPLLVEHETKSKQYENIGATTLNLLKTAFPALYQQSK